VPLAGRAARPRDRAHQGGVGAGRTEGDRGGGRRILRLRRDPRRARRRRAQGRGRAGQRSRERGARLDPFEPRDHPGLVPASSGVRSRWPLGPGGESTRRSLHMSENPIQVFIASFDNEYQAKQVLDDFKSMHREGSIDLIDAAVIVRKADGKVHYEETADPSGKKWAKRGAIAGGLVGLIFPPTIIASAVIGGGAGGIWGKIRGKGFKDEDLKAIGEELEPGSSAIIAIAEDNVLDRLQQ